jgi:hypothetical protein
MLKTNIIFLAFYIIFLNNLYANATGEVLQDTGKGAVVGTAANMTSSAAGKAAVEKVSAGSSEKIANFFENPPGIALMSGIATVYSTTLYNAAAEQEKEANENIVKIEKIIKSYSDSWQDYCPNGREKLEEPGCYCYIETGKENPKRSNSQVCIDLWAKNKYLLSGAAASYASAPMNYDPAGCVSVDGQFDERCKCKKMLNSKGENACQKAVTVNIPNEISSAFLSNTGLKDTMKFAANAFSGNPNLNSFNGAALRLKAISGDRFNKSLLSQVGGKFKSPMPEMPNSENVNNFAKAIFGEKAINSAMSSSNGSFASIGSNNLDPKSNQIIQDLKKKNSLDFDGSGKGLNNQKGAKKSGLDFNFSDSGSSGGGAGQVLDNFPEKAYKYKNSSLLNNPCKRKQYLR